MKFGLDFASALYLSFHHESASLNSWSRLTHGKPAILEEVPGTRSIACQLAALQGCEQAVLARSTLHLFWDVFEILAEDRIAIFKDDGAYSIAQWGIERAAARGVPVQRFPHKDTNALERLLSRSSGGRRPVVVTDGMCTSCGCTVPVKIYHELVRRAGGLLVIDDTQALGILGVRQGPGSLYGTGGGGSLRHHNIVSPGVIAISSLAKGFGVPLAVLSGSTDFVRRFKAKSRTRVHCSPPTAADIRAAEHALKLNSERGDALRFQLAQRIQQFRYQLAEVGISADGGIYPIQTLRLPNNLNLNHIHQQLLNFGIRTILRRGCDGTLRLALIITAWHSRQDVENAVHALAGIVKEQPHTELEGG